MDIDVKNICENAKNTINLVTSQGDKVIYVTDMSKVILNYDNFDFDNEYVARDDMQLTEKVNFIRTQKSALQSAMCVILNIEEWPNKKEEMLSYLDTDDGKELQEVIINGYNYCINKGYLDIAELYLYGLVHTWVGEGIVDEMFIKKALLDITSGYAKIAIETDTDQTRMIESLVKKINLGLYGDTAKSIKSEDIASTYNEFGLYVNLHGSRIAIETDKRVNPKNLKIKNSSR